MLHGGKANGRRSSTAAAPRGSARPRWPAPSVPPPRRPGAAVWLLRYRHRGWNGGAGPVEDARWALAQVREEIGEVPIVLLGHSMGARTSVHVADDPQVRGVVALAPWFPPGEPVAALAGQDARRRTRQPRPHHLRAGDARLRRAGARLAGADASYVDMGRVGHYLLRRAAAWNDLALSRSLAAPCRTRLDRDLRNETVSFYGVKRNGFVPTPGVLPTMVPETAVSARPRVEGDREQEILDATLDGARRDRLRPAHHGRRRRPRPRRPRPPSTAAGAPSRSSSSTRSAPTRSTRPPPTPAPCAAT